jgi:predicted HicB family RNase H-like nuclease
VTNLSAAYKIALPKPARGIEPKKHHAPTVNVLKLDPTLNKHLSAVALAEGISRSGFVERAVLDRINRGESR